MDVLLAHGYHLELDEREKAVMKPYPPLGILSIAAFLKARGIDVGVFDSTFAPTSAFAEAIRKSRPSLVGIYCNLMTKGRVLQMIGEVKRAGRPVVVGGPEPPFHAEQFLAHGADVVVLGEGEEAMEELSRALASRSPHELHDVPGIVFRDEHGRAVRTGPRAFVANLDALPPPDRDAIDMEAYLSAWRERHGRSSVSLVCARGCPYHCDWCSHAVYGKTHRRRSPEHVADELARLHERYRPDQLWYADDVFTIHPSWLFRYAQILEERSLRLPFECISRADRLSEPVVETLARMGCFRVWIGSESGSQRLLDAMRRGVTVEQVQAASRRCRRRGIEVGIFLMVGYEGEDASDLRASVAHLKKTAPDVLLTTTAYPIEGTGYYEKVRDRVRHPGAWKDTSDRDAVVAGRRSRRYYEAAMRWIGGEVRFHGALRRPWSGPAGELRRLSTLGRAGVAWASGRIGMAMRAREWDG